MPISDRINKAELSGFLVQDELITTGDLVSDNLGTGGLLTIGEKGVDGYSPVVTIEEIVTSEGREGYIINITDANHPYEGQSFTVMNGAGISNIVLNEDYSLTIYLDDGTEYTTDSIRGETGNGIDHIEKTGSHYEEDGRLIEEYTITYTDGNTFTYYISNGMASTNYNILTNKPSVNGVELVGDKTSGDLGLQPELTNENAGEGISIYKDSSGKVIIENTNVSAEWGNITGTITDQTDLIEYIGENGGKIDSISVNGVVQPIDSSKNVDITVPEVNNAEITLQQNGSTLDTFTLNQAIDQTINLGRSGDWTKLIAIPFDQNNQPLISNEVDLAAVSYYQITSEDRINWSTGTIDYYSGIDLFNIVNSQNCYIWRFDGFSVGAKAEYDFSFFFETDSNDDYFINGKTVADAPDPGYQQALFINYSNDYFRVRFTWPGVSQTTPAKGYIEQYPQETKNLLAIGIDSNGEIAFTWNEIDHYQFIMLEWFDFGPQLPSYVHFLSATEIVDIINNNETVLLAGGWGPVGASVYQYEASSNVDYTSYRPVVLSNNLAHAVFINIDRHGAKINEISISLTDDSGNLLNPAIGHLLVKELQPKLTAGSNIDIDNNNVISATDTIYTAGSNIDIDDNNVISTSTYSGGVSIDVKESNWHDLPDGYTELQSITNSSNTKLQIFSISSSYSTVPINIELYIKFKCGTTSSNYLFQARDTSSGIIYGISGSGTGGTIIAGWGGSSVVSSITRTVGNTYEITATFTVEGTITLNVKELDTGLEDTKTGTYTWSIPSSGFYLFGNYGGNYLSPSGAEVYEIRYTLNGLLRTLIPAIKDSNSVIGFSRDGGFRYIGVSGSDSGELIAGPLAFRGRIINYNGDYYSGTNGITINKSDTSATIGLVANLVLDCGTSTINV